jgi:uncharacterized membrane protein
LSSWAVIALVSAAVTALVSIFDKTIIFRYARTRLTLPLLIGLAQTNVGIVVLVVVRVPSGATLEATGFALLSGALFGLSGLLLMRVLYTQEVSRTIPVTQTAPIFVAFMAVALLGESISPRQWLAVIATVGGAILLSLRIDAGLKALFLHRSFFLLMLGAVIQAAANILGKLAVDDLPVLYTHGLRILALGLVFLLFAARREPWSNVRGFFTSRSPALLFVAANELVIANGGMVLLLWAFSLGPVSLVTALASARSLFVVAYSMALALTWKGALGEQTSRGAIAVKVTSTALIVGGVATIAL